MKINFRRETIIPFQSNQVSLNGYMSWTNRLIVIFTSSFVLSCRAFPLLEPNVNEIVLRSDIDIDRNLFESTELEEYVPESSPSCWVSAADAVSSLPGVVYQKDVKKYFLDEESRRQFTIGLISCIGHDVGRSVFLETSPEIVCNEGGCQDICTYYNNYEAALKPGLSKLYIGSCLHNEYPSIAVEHAYTRAETVFNIIANQEMQLKRLKELAIALTEEKQRNKVDCFTEHFAHNTSCFPTSAKLENISVTNDEIETILAQMLNQSHKMEDRDIWFQIENMVSK